MVKGRRRRTTKEVPRHLPREPVIEVSGVSSLDELKTLTVEELSDATGIAAWRIRELLKAGKGPPSFRVGRTYRFPIGGVRRWLEEQTKD